MRPADCAPRSATSPTAPRCGAAVGWLGALDVLVNNAGLELITPMLEPGDEVEKTFARIIEINVIGTYYVTREALPLMRAGGSIVLTSSIWGKTGAADFSAYVTSKHANIGFMRVLAKELGPKGIRVNAVCPGLGEDARGAALARQRSPTRRASTRTTMLGQILAGAGAARPDGAGRRGEPLSLPRLRPCEEHHRTGGQCRPRRGTMV